MLTKPSLTIVVSIQYAAFDSIGTIQITTTLSYLYDALPETGNRIPSLYDANEVKTISYASLITHHFQPAFHVVLNKLFAVGYLLGFVALRLAKFNSGRVVLIYLLYLLLSCSGIASAQTRIDLQGHRGARGLMPENTLPAFERALELQVTTLELDVVSTRDGVLVISHDPSLNPDLTRNAQGEFLKGRGLDIISLTWAQLQNYDVGRINPSSRYAQAFSSQKPMDGTRIPRLKDLFDRVNAMGNKHVQFAIETKITPSRPDQTPEPEAFAKLLLKDIEESGMQGRVQILSFDWRTLQAVQRLAPGTSTVYISAQLPTLDNLMIRGWQDSPWTAGFQFKTYGSVPRMIKAAGGSHWSSFWRELDASQVKEAHSLGLKVLAWTVNDHKVMNEMLDLGVDGLVTDRPDIAREVLQARGIIW